jgi:hypothetical protein
VILTYYKLFPCRLSRGQKIFLSLAMPFTTVFHILSMSRRIKEAQALMQMSTGFHYIDIPL